ncbi:MAG: hypothetical protein ACI9D5_001983 [Candidatus Endobugula sp.]
MIISTLGVLEWQEKKTTFTIGRHTFTVNDKTKMIVDGIAVPDTFGLNNEHIAIIKGFVNNNDPSTAEKIIVSTQVSGIIAQVTGKSITALGQTIILHNGIIFDEVTTELPD